MLAADAQQDARVSMFEDVYKDVPWHLRAAARRARGLSHGHMTMIQALNSAWTP